MPDCTRLPGLILFAAVSCSLAQAPPRLRPSIRTIGEATVTAKPDRVVIGLAVVTQAQTAEAAATQNAARLDAVLRELKSVAGAAAEIRTAGYSLDPNYRYPTAGGAPELVGYTARNSVEVTTPELAAAGKILDAATRAGANSIDRLQFTLKDDQAARGQALREAAAKARASADAIASALGVKIAGVLLAEETAGAPPRPVYPMARMAEATSAASTPVAPGTIEVHGMVTLTVEIAQ